MGLHSPFNYVGYEVSFSEIFINILDKLCAHCHTADDYRKGCRECPAGNLAFECRRYILSPDESDKQFELYASGEWAEKKEKLGHPKPSEETREKDRQIALEYKPECDVLRAMKHTIRSITPHSFFYVRHHRKYPYERPKALTEFAELTKNYKILREARLRKWGL